MIQRNKKNSLVPSNGFQNQFISKVISRSFFWVVNGPPLYEEENLRIWNRAGFKRGVQQTSDDMSHAAVSP